MQHFNLILIKNNLSLTLYPIDDRSYLGFFEIIDEFGSEQNAQALHCVSLSARNDDLFQFLL
jgi:hypothetical protein